jgi:hypothetical protein
VASFANGVDRDINAARAAITSGWSNGQTEEQITTLKLVKRQMYGRGKAGSASGQAHQPCHMICHQTCVRASFDSV